MESWRTVWREGFAPILPRAGLEALAERAIVIGELAVELAEAP